MERLSRGEFAIELEDLVNDGTEFVILSDWVMVGEGGLIIYAKYPSGLERTITGPNMNSMNETAQKLFLTQVAQICEVPRDG